MPRVSEEHRAAMRERIVQAAVAVIERKGLVGMTMADVIAECGLSAGAIYGYYKGKEQLILDVAGSVLRSRKVLLDSLSELNPVPPPAEAVGILLRSLPPTWLSSGLFLQILGGAAAYPDILVTARELVGGLRDSVADYLAAYLRQQGIASDRAQLLAERAAPALVSVVQGFLLQQAAGLPIELDAYLDGAAVVLRGEFA